MAAGKIYAMIAALLWGSAPIIAQLALEGASARLVTILGTMSGFLLLVLIGLLRGEQGWFSSPLPAIGIYVAIGITGSMFGRMFSVKGIEKVGSARSNSVVNSSPLLTVLFAVFLLGEQFTLVIGTGVGLTLIGIYLLSFGRGDSGPRNFRRIDFLWPLGAAFFYSFNPILKRVSMGIESAPLMGMIYSSGTAALIFLVSFILQRTWVEVRAVSQRHLIYIVVSGFFGAVGGYMTFLAIQDQPVLVASSIWRVSPLVSLLASYLILRRAEQITYRDALGTLAIVCGVFVLVRLTN